MAKFTTKKSVKHYVGVFEEISDNSDPLIRFVRLLNSSKTSTVFRYPAKEDVGEILEEDNIDTTTTNP